MTWSEAEKFVTSELNSLYDASESFAIARQLIDHLSQQSKVRRSSINVSDPVAEQLHKIVSRLLNHEPLQYVLGETWFYGLRFHVDKNVLIPRPETEELVDWVIKDCKFPVNELSILDVGTGSGCIAISLKRKLRKAIVTGCDVSENALKVAKLNAGSLGVEVQFFQLDFLNATERERLPRFDIIVSNPPYIPAKDISTLRPNVRDYEPANALFVPDEDPLVFYKAIMEFGRSHLANGGSIYSEIHEDRGHHVLHLFGSNGYKTEIRKDMQGKDRMIRARQ
jgi:release factor glutamine methyltransferase